MTWVLALIAIGGWVFAMHFHASAMRAFSGWQRALDGWEESDKLSDEDEQRYETLWGWYNRAYGDVWSEKWSHLCTVFAACAALGLERQREAARLMTELAEKAGGYEE
jgi:hypothetical protein